ncbi:hypothetical protein E1091_17580, partial [Micromonospora fluostatini]
AHHPIRLDQALLYRLNGDRNPLHSDPVVAARAGLPGPVLHGLCTYGFAARTLLHTVAEGDPDRFRRVSARFSAPLFPGDTLTVLVWRRPAGALFQAVDGRGRPVLDRGVVDLRRPAPARPPPAPARHRASRPGTSGPAGPSGGRPHRTEALPPTTTVTSVLHPRVAI